jgi:hypothetical protein
MGIIVLSDQIAYSRREQCFKEGCEYLDRLDYNDSCAFCPNGHFETFCCHDKRVQEISEAPVKRRKYLAKPGDALSLAIRKIIGVHPCGACLACITEMNNQGWWWCWRNRKVISKRLAGEARRRGHEIDDDSALDLIKAAFREMRAGAKIKVAKRDLL